MALQKTQNNIFLYDEIRALEKLLEQVYISCRKLHCMLKMTKYGIYEPYTKPNTSPTQIQFLIFAAL